MKKNQSEGSEKMAADQAMHLHPVPGRIVRQWIIPAREYSAFAMRRGQTLRFVDIEGKQVPDLVCFNEHDLSEQLNMGNSLLLNKRRELRRGDVFYSVICNPMITIIGYSDAESYSYGPMCSEELNRIRYGVPGTRNCRLIGHSFWGSATENSKLSPAILRQRAFENLRSTAEGTDWPHPQFGLENIR